MSVPVWIYVHPMCIPRDQKRTGVPGSCYLSDRGSRNKSQVPKRAASPLNLWAVLHPCLPFYKTAKLCWKTESKRVWEGIPHCMWGLSLLRLHLESRLVLFREVENAHIPFGPGFFSSCAVGMDRWAKHIGFHVVYNVSNWEWFPCPSGTPRGLNVLTGGGFGNGTLDVIFYSLLLKCLKHILRQWQLHDIW